MIRQAPKYAANRAATDPIKGAIDGFRLSRIDIHGLDLQPGTSLTLGIRSDDDHVREFPPIVGEDRAPPQKLSVSLPVMTAEQTGQVRLVVIGGEVGALAAAEIIPVYSNDRWSEYLPAVFREDQRQADFLSRYLGALFVEGEGIEAVLDGFAKHLIPWRVPSEDGARFLGGWLDVDIDLIVKPVVEDRTRQRSPRAEEENQKSLSLPQARQFLSRVLPHALANGTVKAFLIWVDAVAEARGMQPHRRREIKVVEGFKMRRLFTLPRASGRNDPEPTELQRGWGRLPDSAPLANDPLAHRAYLDENQPLNNVTLGLPGEDEDPTLLARLLGGRLWLFVPEPQGNEPAVDEWPRLLASVLPAHLKLEVREGAPPVLPIRGPAPSRCALGSNTVLGVNTRLAISETSA